MSKELLEICILFLEQMAGTDDEGGNDWRKACVAYKNATGKDYCNLFGKRKHKYSIGDVLTPNTLLKNCTNLPLFEITNIDYTDGTYIFDREFNSFGKKRMKFEIIDKLYQKQN